MDGRTQTSCLSLTRRRPKGLYLETWQPRYSDRQRLPLDVLMVIASEADLNVEYYLSQTCRELRRFLHRDWRAEVASLSTREQFQFLIAIARRLPNRWVCDTCIRIHKFDPDDIPSRDLLNRNCGAGKESSALCGFKPVHIQQALKLDMMGGTTHQDYLRRVLVPRRYKTRRDRDEGLLSSLICTTVVAPKIVAGRFLIMRELSLVAPWSSVTYEEAMGHWVCPHLSVLHRFSVLERYSGYCYSDELESAFASAHASRGHQVVGHCRECTTDYSVLFADKTVTLWVWHDCGPYGAPDDPTWRALLFKKYHGGRTWTHPGHVAGSIRELYMGRDAVRWGCSPAVHVSRQVQQSGFDLEWDVVHMAQLRIGWDPGNRG